VIVVPFEHAQTAILKDAVDLWSSIPACRQEQNALADLKFVASVHPSDLSVAAKAMSQESFLHCFREVTYTMSNLKPLDDWYPYAPNCLFFWMMFDAGLAGTSVDRERLGLSNTGGYKYIMQQELDVHPIAPMWLSTVVGVAKNYTSDNSSSSQPWVIGAGTVIHEHGRRIKAMNGNSIYVNDPHFLKFLRRFRAHFRCEDRAYDTSMAYFLANEGLESDSHFISTPYIVNCGLRPVSDCAQQVVDQPYITSEAVLVHAKHVSKSNWASFLRLRNASMVNTTLSGGKDID